MRNKTKKNVSPLAILDLMFKFDREIISKPLFMQRAMMKKITCYQPKGQLIPQLLFKRGWDFNCVSRLTLVGLWGTGL